MIAYIREVQRTSDELSIRTSNRAPAGDPGEVWRPENTRENVTGGDERRGLKAKKRKLNVLKRR